MTQRRDHPECPTCGSHDTNHRINAIYTYRCRECGRNYNVPETLSHPLFNE